MRRQVATVAEFLDLTDLSLQTRRTVEEKYGLPFFLSAIMYGKVIHVNFSFFYSCHIVQDHGHLKSRIFATMAT